MDSVLHSDGNKHHIRSYQKSYAVFSVLEVFFDDSNEIDDFDSRRVAYQCVANNSMGTASDAVTVQVTGTYYDRT